MSVWSSLGATLASSAIGDDLPIKINHEKIREMQTDVSIEGVGGLGRADVIKRADLSGHVQLDMQGQKLKMIMSGAIEAGPPLGYTMKGKSEIFVDGPARILAIRGQGTLADANYCHVITKALPQMLAPRQRIGMYPLKIFGMVRSVLGGLEDRTNAELNAIPHTVEDGVVTFKSPPPPSYVSEKHVPYPVQEVQMHKDGVPIKIKEQMVCDETCLQDYGSMFHGELPSLELNFSNWQAGAGDLEGFSCPTSSTMDLSAHPHAMHAVIAYDLLIQQLLEHPATQDFAEQLPSTVALWEEHAHLASRQEKNTSIWSSLVVSLVAGMSGGAVVLALAAAFARKTWVTEPLLSHA